MTKSAARNILFHNFVGTSLGANEHPFLLGSVVYLKGGLLSSALVGDTQQFFEVIASMYTPPAGDEGSGCSTCLTTLGIASLFHARHSGGFR